MVFFTIKSDYSITHNIFKPETIKKQKNPSDTFQRGPALNILPDFLKMALPLKLTLVSHYLARIRPVLPSCAFNGMIQVS